MSNQEMNIIYDLIDALISSCHKNKDYNPLNHIIADINPSICSQDLLLTILIATLSVKSKLNGRQRLYNYLGDFGGGLQTETKELLKGLE